MNMTLKTLQEILCRAFFGDTTDDHMKCVVPRQGNFYNPQQVSKVPAYFMYWISEQQKSHTMRTDGLNKYTYVLTSVEVQAVGNMAEELMQSTLFWDERSDLRKLFAEYDATLMNGDRTIIAIPFIQDGNNTVLAYNTTLVFSNTLTYSEQRAEDDKYWKSVLLRGNIKTGE